VYRVMRLCVMLAAVVCRQHVAARQYVLVCDVDTTCTDAKSNNTTTSAALTITITAAIVTAIAIAIAIAINRPLQEAITVLKQTLPVPPLARDSGIDKASNDHATDMSTSGQVSTSNSILT
jgi:hypothetical protein